MLKTANEVADTILEKVAVSMDMARRAFTNALTRQGHTGPMPNMDYNPMLQLLAHKAPRTLLRGEGYDRIARPGLVDPLKRHSMALLAHNQSGRGIEAHHLNPRLERTGDAFFGATQGIPRTPV
jgi:hypothetical protein